MAGGMFGFRPNTLLLDPLLAQPTGNEANWRRKLANQGSISRARPSLGQRLENRAVDALAKVMPQQRANRIGARAFGAVNDLTPVGNVTMAADAGSAFNKGHWLQGTGLGALAILPGAIGKAGRGGMFGIRAWHGSPHDFDKFSLDKIGTGEGAQAYGHGLYFAEKPEVAKLYRDTLAGERVKLGDRAFDVGWHTRSQMSDPAEIAAEAVHRFKGDVPTAIEWLGNAEATSLDRQAAKLLNKYHTKGAVAVEANPGRLYEVNINAKPEDFLDYDAPLSKQPRALNALKKADLSPLMSRTRKMLEWAREGTEQPHNLALGRELLNAVSHYGDNRGTAEWNALMPHGILGVRYLDQGSRGSGRGSRNFVVFDDGLIDILNKY